MHTWTLDLYGADAGLDRARRTATITDDEAVASLVALLGVGGQVALDFSFQGCCQQALRTNTQDLRQGIGGGRGWL